MKAEGGVKYLTVLTSLHLQLEYNNRGVLTV